ncbi:polypeptide N-acetylgalactosaminyltransferase 4-like [Pecten maximus]|uniref:polypeptide N-acetylgalactosaminyltransferase 4-like n=1 Tax=Pecten maximus TaxID=6579 RepID=UPI001458E090|nr:polypeptide N-acetylgalactosaminyltransferase 4-like [Pecten maximus]
MSGVYTRSFRWKMRIIFAVTFVIGMVPLLFWMTKLILPWENYGGSIMVKTLPRQFSSQRQDSDSDLKKTVDIDEKAQDKSLEEYEPKKIKIYNFSDIIRDFNISLYKDIDPYRFCINVTKTHETSVNRQVLDTRPGECNSVKYNIMSLPVASIVIPVFNEPWSTFERLINSILKHSPRLLLQEIIIIDDKSDLDYLGAPLQKYVEQFVFMHLHRTKERLGTMKTRVMGTKLAKADVVVFLDSHTEVNAGWLEPLLYEISQNGTAIVQPSIDIIDAQTFEYSKYFDNNIRGHFKWSMAYTFVPLTPQQMTAVRAQPTKAFDTPAIVGCAFAVNRKYFLDIGGLDTGMRTWGGEDVELSIRVWLCGGSMKISPCSHVAHIFKAGHPFKMEYSDLVYNNRRTAEMWLGDYRKYFYYFNAGFAKPPEATDKFDIMDPVKKKFKCKGFGWFLQNVFPELEVPPEGTLYFGTLRNSASDCVGPSDSVKLQSYPLLVSAYCYLYYKARNFALLENGRLMIDGKCIKVRQDLLVVGPCTNGIGKWSLKEKLLMYIDGSISKCATQVTKVINSEKLQVIKLMPCIDTTKTSEWEFANKIFKG